METDKKMDSSAAAGTSLAAPKSSSRRRLLQAGLGASPAILTIVSEPVRAFTRTQSLPCRSASAFASIAAAQHAGFTTSASTQQTCSGMGPISWNTTTTWPVAKTTAFSTAIGTYTFRSNTAPTLLDILSASAPYSSTEMLARNFVAAYLNAQGTPKTPLAVVTDLQLKTMWTQISLGSYTPTSGTSWAVSDLNGWLVQTFAGST
jgi:hypothetical protein